MCKSKQLNITELIVLLVLCSLDTIGSFFIDFGDFFGINQEASNSYNIMSHLISWLQWE